MDAVISSHRRPQKRLGQWRSVRNKALPQSQPPKYLFDLPLLLGFVLLLALGLLMVSSASMEFAELRYGEPLYFAIRQSLYILVALVAALVVYLLPLQFWQKNGLLLSLLTTVLLALVLVPGIGREINGSRRWIELPLVSFQPSELVKFCMVIYMAGFLVRHGEAVRNRYRALLPPVLLFALLFSLILVEPDLGSVVVLLAGMLILMFLGGMRLLSLVAFCFTGLIGCIWLISTTPYRVARLVAFRDPWLDPLGSGYQLSHSLIAFGRGEWFGAGLGHSIQKQLYLPEVHTDFVFSIIGEELGLVGVVAVIGLYTAIFLRLLAVARRAENSGAMFIAYVLYGVTVLLGIQTYINMGVGFGLLPTKGLTLPFISYGGSSLVVCCMLAGLSLKAVYELNRRCRDGWQRNQSLPGVDL